MAALNGWILPLLYGLLGATVFPMRNILDTRTPHIEVFSSILRIALGGIAGIVIGCSSLRARRERLRNEHAAVSSPTEDTDSRRMARGERWNTRSPTWG